MASKQWASSRINVDRTHFEWRIENFHRQPQKYGEWITSPVFYSGNSKETEWQLQVYLNGNSTCGEGFVIIYIFLKASAKPPVKFTCELSAINPTNKTKLCKHVKTDALGVAKNSLLCTNFLPRAPLLEKNENYLMNDTLTICCNMEVSSNDVISSSMNALEAQLTPILSEHGLGQDLMKVFADPEDTDVTLVVDDKKLRAHKVILVARSPVFAAMFSNKTTLESQKNEVKIDDLTANVVKHMLKYMYTDKVDDRSLVMELLGAAQKYQLEGLEAKCAIIIMEDLNEENAADALCYADLYGPDGLKEYIIDFILGHEIEVQQSSGFKQLEAEQPGLLVEIYKVQVAKRKENMKVET